MNILPKMDKAESVLKRAHIFIEGRVQGVGFRYFIQTNAGEMGINGWVKNLSDGRVEAVFEGPKEKVMNMVERCKRGPGASRVENINLKWDEIDKTLQSFNVKY